MNKYNNNVKLNSLFRVTSQACFIVLVTSLFTDNGWLVHGIMKTLTSYSCNVCFFI